MLESKFFMATEMARVQRPPAMTPPPCGLRASCERDSPGACAPTHMIFSEVTPMIFIKDEMRTCDKSRAHEQGGWSLSNGAQCAGQTQARAATHMDPAPPALLLSPLHARVSASDDDDSMQLDSPTAGACTGGVAAACFSFWACPEVSPSPALDEDDLTPLVLEPLDMQDDLEASIADLDAAADVIGAGLACGFRAGGDRGTVGRAAANGWHKVQSQPGSPAGALVGPRLPTNTLQTAPSGGSDLSCCTIATQAAVGSPNPASVCASPAFGAPAFMGPAFYPAAAAAGPSASGGAMWAPWMLPWGQVAMAHPGHGAAGTVWGMPMHSIATAPGIPIGLPMPPVNGIAA